MKELYSAVKNIAGPVWFYVCLKSQNGVAENLWWDGTRFEGTVQNAAPIAGVQDDLPGTSTTTNASWYATLPDAAPAGLYYWEAWHGGHAGSGGTFYDDGTFESGLAGVETIAVFGPLIPSMTSDSAPSGSVSASSIYSTGYDAWNALDGNSATWWNSDGSSALPQWIQYQFPSAVTAFSYSLTSNGLDTGAGGFPAAWTIEGSNDGSTWTVLDSRTFSGITGDQTLTYNLATTGSYEYYRVNVTAANGGGSNCEIGEWQLYGGVATALALALACRRRKRRRQSVQRRRFGYALRRIAGVNHRRSCAARECPGDAPPRRAMRPGQQWRYFRRGGRRRHRGRQPMRSQILPRWSRRLSELVLSGLAGRRRCELLSVAIHDPSRGAGKLRWQPDPHLRRSELQRHGLYGAHRAR